MTMSEIVDRISFLLGIPSNENVEDLDFTQGVRIAFQELKRYMRTSVDKTVPYQRRIDLEAVGINTVKVLPVEFLILVLTISCLHEGGNAG